MRTPCQRLSTFVRTRQSNGSGMSDQPANLTPPPQGYAEWLAELKTRIHTAQQRATLAVNHGLADDLALVPWLAMSNIGYGFHDGLPSS